jgi:hypothetical protein
MKNSNLENENNKIITEEQFNLFLDNKLKKFTTDIQNDITGIFIYGIFSGLIISYTGFLSYFLGVTSGMIISLKYSYIIINCSLNIGKFINYIKKSTLKSKIKKI